MPVPTFWPQISRAGRLRRRLFGGQILSLAQTKYMIGGLKHRGTDGDSSTSRFDRPVELSLECLDILGYLSEQETLNDVDVALIETATRWLDRQLLDDPSLVDRLSETLDRHLARLSPPLVVRQNRRQNSRQTPLISLAGSTIIIV